MILGILLTVLGVVIVFAALNSALRNATRGVDGATGLINRFNAWLGGKLAAQRKTQAERQAWFDEQIAKKRAGK